MSVGDLGITPRDHALIGQIFFAAVCLLGGDRRGPGGVGVGSQDGGVAADQDGEGLTDTNRLPRRDQYAFDTARNGGGYGGARIHHRLDAAGQADFASSAAADGDDRDADSFDLCGRQINHALHCTFVVSAVFNRLCWRGFRLAVK
jgi:hypothetical protein